MDWKSAIAAGVGGLITALGIFLLGLIPNPRTLVVPEGTVVATTDTKCGKGWREYKAPGRVLIGADGTNIPSGDSGGHPEQTLSVANLPPHAHEQQLSGTLGPHAGYKQIPGQAWGYTGNLGKDVAYWTGGGRGQAVPFSIMQPYVALVFCEKE